MCGILGILPGKDREVFDRGFVTLQHRGPDDEGFWSSSDKRILLGHKRLSILDLSENGRQPMRFDNLVIVYNGEVYNYIELRAELESKGYSFSSGTDTEVILKAFHCWGLSCFNRFNGMWAVGIYDKAKRRLLLVRDRYGIKPLYFCKLSSKFLFASEVRAIHTVLGNDIQYNEKVLQEISNGGFGYQGKNETYLRGVESVPAGSYLELDPDLSYSINQWYELKPQEVPSTFSEQASQLQELLTDAVKLRMRSDVPVATCLSGGLDSSSISAIIHKSDQIDQYHSNFTHQAYCASFPNTPIDESVKASFLARELNLELDTTLISCPEPEILEKQLIKCDGPMNSLAFYPINVLYDRIKEKGIKVTLDGQGPDEMLGGYKPIKYALLAALGKKDFKWFFDIYKIYSMQGDSAQVSSKSLSRKILRSTLLHYGVDRVKDIIGIGTKSIYSDQSGPRFLDNIFDRNLHYQFFSNPLPAILRQFDQCSMQAGVECRMPFMDHRIVEFIFSLPTKSKVGNGYNKSVLRQAVKDLLPDEIRLNKQKIGFNAPIVDWYRGGMSSWMNDLMNSQPFLDSPYFNGPRLLVEFDEFQRSSSPQWYDAWKFWGPLHVTHFLANREKYSSQNLSILNSGTGSLSR